MFTECTVNARARRVSTCEMTETRRVSSGMSWGGVRHQAGVSSVAHKPRHAQPVFAAAF